MTRQPLAMKVTCFMGRRWQCLFPDEVSVGKPSLVCKRDVADGTDQKTFYVSDGIKLCSTCIHFTHLSSFSGADPAFDRGWGWLECSQRTPWDGHNQLRTRYSFPLDATFQRKQTNKDFCNLKKRETWGGCSNKDHLHKLCSPRNPWKFSKSWQGVTMLLPLHDLFGLFFLWPC